MRLIDADALYEKTAEWEAQALAQVERYNLTDSRDEWLRWSYVLKERSAFKFDVADAPTIDAVEVVRCKDCKYSVDYYNDGECYCRRPGREMQWISKKWDFFCKAGRRSDETD